MKGTEKRLFEELVRHAREDRDEEAGFEAHWARLAAGTLAPEEEERLRAEAAESEEARAAWEVFRPLGADFHARVTQELRGLLETPPRPRAKARDESRRIPFPKPRRRHLFAWAAAAAAAAVALSTGLYRLRPVDEAPLPPFEFDVRGVAGQRALTEEAETEVLVPGSSFLVRLIPEQEVSGRVAARCFMVRDGRWRSWPVDFETAPSGALRAEPRMEGDLLLEPGLWTLVTVVGRPRRLPSEKEIREHFEAADGAAGAQPAETSWRLFHKRLKVEPGAER